MRSKIEIEFADALKRHLGSKIKFNDKYLPGTPDIVFPEEQLVIFFNGCFWHSHHCRELRVNDKWKNMLAEIKEKDILNNTLLQVSGYETLSIWECEWKAKPDFVLEKITARLYFSRLPALNRKKYQRVRLN